MQRSNRASRLIFSAAAATALVSFHADAAKTWVGSNGNWSVGANWNPASMPGGGETVYLSQGAFTATLDAAAGNPNLASLQIYNGMTLLHSNTNTLNVTTLTVSSNGASGAGTYALQNGTLAVSGFSTVGYNSAGYFAQSGGYHSAGTLEIGGHDDPSPPYFAYPGTGTYLMSGGTLTAPGMYVGKGYYGTGNFVISGGLVNATNLIRVAGGLSTITQTAGTLNTPSLDIILGTYVYAGGTLNVQSTYISGRMDCQSGTTFTVAGPSATPAKVEVLSGSLSFATMNLGGGHQLRHTAIEIRFNGRWYAARRQRHRRWYVYAFRRDILC